jgi:hypothetical protein
MVYLKSPQLPPPIPHLRTENILLNAENSPSFNLMLNVLSGAGPINLGVIILTFL